ncbi:hypothetical protein QA612_20690 [Evansella sp. AB-P1]|uniref:DUF6612 family protein n=1 Tax=Evansella sp. AB-P1 TaxID=3037653 RepID=UPI00241C0F86|nr:DUF6612 family protein [Evansella sp. AB-P1]MDG5789878.1 hypothetical protein [Evansella sp. AB-P1]
MRKFLFVFTILIMSWLAACSTNDQEASNYNSANENEENVTTEDYNEKEENAHEEANNEEEESTNEVEEAFSSEGHEIIVKTSEAMDNLMSYKLEGSFFETDTSGDGSEQIDSEMLMKMAFSEDDVFTMYGNVISEYEDEEAEYYLVEDAMYIKEDMWFKMPRSDDNHSFQAWADTGLRDIDEYTDFSDQFEITDNGDHYSLKFKAEAYDAIFHDDLSHLSARRLEEANIAGMYELVVEKDSYYLLSHNMELQVVSGEGEILLEYEASFTYSDFNEYDEITAPDEVVNEAVPVGQ